MSFFFLQHLWIQNFLPGVGVLGLYYELHWIVTSILESTNLWWPPFYISWTIPEQGTSSSLTQIWRWDIQEIPKCQVCLWYLKNKLLKCTCMFPFQQLLAPFTDCHYRFSAESSEQSSGCVALAVTKLVVCPLCRIYGLLLVGGMIYMLEFLLSLCCREEKENRFAASKMAVVSIMRTWSG